MEKDLKKNIYIYVCVYIYIRMYNNHFVLLSGVQQHCKATILQFLKMKKEYNRKNILEVRHSDF